MHISEMSRSRYLRTSDLQGRDVAATIAGVEREQVGVEREEVWVLHFVDCKPLIINETNLATLGEVVGDETDHWKGRRVSLYPTTTNYKGRTVPCIRVRDRQPADESPGQGAMYAEHARKNGAVDEYLR